MVAGEGTRLWRCCHVIEGTRLWRCYHVMTEKGYNCYHLINEEWFFVISDYSGHQVVLSRLHGVLIRHTLFRRIARENRKPLE